MGHHHHGSAAPARCAVITASDTRTAADDLSGDLAQRLLEQAGHLVIVREIVPDEPQRIRGAVAALPGHAVRAVVITGGTGIAPRDRTYEAVTAIIERELPGFGELFRSLSHDEIGSAAMLSRATAGIAGRLFIASLPGSPDAVRLGLERLIIPELGHVLRLLGD